jgi:thiol-disulfide isomerase/thioredoxin
MKKFLLILILPLFMACSEKSENVVLTLTLENATFNKAEVNIIKDFIAYNRETRIAEADSNGVFTLELEIQHPQLIFITLGQIRTSVYLEKGGDLQLFADMNNWDTSLTFTGDYANENNFLVLNSRALATDFNQNNTMNLYRSGTAEEFQQYAKDMQSTSAELLKDFGKKNKLSKDFTRFFLTDVTYTYYSNLLNFSPYYNYFNQTEPELTEGYYDFLKDALVFSDESFNVRSFADFLNVYHQYYIRTNKENIPADMDEFEQSKWAVNEIYTGKARDFVMANIINAELNWGEFTKAETSYNEFRDSGADLALVEILRDAYESALRVTPGNAAPAFTLTDINGNNVSLSDFEGKVVYLDFWASWCGPCMREVPHAKELKKRFEGQEDLVFLYISVDEDPEAWKRTVELHQIEGVHLNVKGMKAETALSYNVKGVPSFFIIDKKGIIHDNNPGRPSSGDVIDQQLRTALGV